MLSMKLKGICRALKNAQILSNTPQIVDSCINYNTDSFTGC